MRIASRSLRVLSSLVCLAGPGLAHAGGTLLHEYATDSASLANAGAPGPSTVAGNPAGLAFLPGSQLGGGLPDVRGILGAPLGLDRQIPQSATLSLYHAFDSRWAVLASAGWQDWSAFGRGGIERDADTPVSATSDRKYRDTWHLAVGTQYQATPALRWQAGLAYDSAAVSERDRTFDTPMAKAWRLGAGVNYAFEPGVELNLNYTFVWMGDMPIAQSKGLNGHIATSGEFANAAIHVLSGSITWRY